MSHQECEVYTLQQGNRADVTFPTVGWLQIARANYSLISPLSPSTPSFLFSWTVSSLSLSDVCSQTPSSGIRCRQSGKSWLGETGWRKTSRHRFPPLCLRTRRSLSLKCYSQRARRFVLMTVMQEYAELRVRLEWKCAVCLHLTSIKTRNQI